MNDEPKIVQVGTRFGVELGKVTHIAITHEEAVTMRSKILRTQAIHRSNEIMRKHAQERFSGVPICKV